MILNNIRVIPVSPIGVNINNSKKDYEKKEKKESSSSEEFEDIFQECLRVLAKKDA